MIGWMGGYSVSEDCSPIIGSPYPSDPIRHTLAPLIQVSQSLKGILCDVGGPREEKNKTLEAVQIIRIFRALILLVRWNPGAKPRDYLPYRMILKAFAGEYADHLMQACASNVTS